jgi:LuxR family transcriptional regulator, quorum-sensing system regulator CciR
MTRFRDVQTFVEDVQRITSFEELKDMMESMSKSLGFDYFALVHNVAFAGRDVLELANYPSTWFDMVKERKYFSDDPVLVACEQRSVGFRWSDVPNLIQLNERQLDILKGARAAGIGGGFTVPVHIPGEYAGSCSFGVRLGRSFSDKALPAAQYTGCFAFEAARRLLSMQVSQCGREMTVPPKLTDRQLECMAMVARGKSDGVAAQMLGIADHTVHQHIEDAKRRYGVSTRMQLVVRALFDGQLTFRDIMRRPPSPD